MKIYAMALWCLINGCGLFFNASGIAAEPVTLTTFEYPPYMSEQTGQRMLMEIVEAAFREMEVTVNRTFYPLKRTTFLRALCRRRFFTQILREIS